MSNYLNFIDISSWQNGLDLESVFAANPLNGVIVKATGGVSHVQKTCDPWAQWLIRNGKPWGFYHYLNDDGKNSSGKAEAEFFVKHCINYFGRGMPWIDYEDTAVKLGTNYLYECLDTVRTLTGVSPGVYCSLSVVQAHDFTRISEEGFPLWIAQYTSNTAVSTFETNPWQFGSVSPFNRYVMHQYSPAGKLNGYGGYLDLDRFYGSEDDWNSMAGIALSDTPSLDTVVNSGLSKTDIIKQLIFLTSSIHELLLDYYKILNESGD